MVEQAGKVGDGQRDVDRRWVSSAVVPWRA